MRIKVTEIEADAKELRESQTLSQNLIKIMTRALQSPAIEDDESADDGESAADGDEDDDEEGER